MSTTTCPDCEGRHWVNWDVPIDDPRFGLVVPCPACTPPSEQTLDNYDSSVHVTAIAALAHARAWPAKPWLALAGPVGSGKTHLLTGIADRSLRDRIPHHVYSGEALLDHIRAAFSLDGEQRLVYEAILRQMFTSPWPLLIDDLGTGRQITDWAWDRLDVTLCDRYGPPPLPTVWTTNMTWQEFRRQLPRAASRLAEVGVWCPIEAGDYRLRLRG